MRFFLATIIGLLLLGCRDGDERRDDAGTWEPEVVRPAPVRVDDSRTDLLFRYLDQGELVIATSIRDVPEEARKRVLVVDMSLPPSSRGAESFVVVADLGEKRPDGTYPTRVVSRKEYEAGLPAVEQAAGGARTEVVFYSTSWCPVCDKARSYLKRKKVRYVEKDVEKTPGAQKELQARAAKAGVRLSGVPVFVVGDRVLPGFDPSVLDSILSKR